MPEDVTRIEGPVSMVVTREISPKLAGDYEDWIERVGKAAREVDPNLSMTVIRPGGSQQNQYVTVFHFSSHEKLDEWEGSDQRKKLQGEADWLREDNASFSEVTGFEYWFSLPKVAAIKPPARYKMALITVLALYAISLTYTHTVDVWLGDLPDHLGIVIRVVILVLVMTYAVMPLMSRLFARWLYPRAARTAGGKSD